MIYRHGEPDSGVGKAGTSKEGHGWPQSRSSCAALLSWPVGAKWSPGRAGLDDRGPAAALLWLRAWAVVLSRASLTSARSGSVSWKDKVEMRGKKKVIPVGGRTDGADPDGQLKRKTDATELPVEDVSYSRALEHILLVSNA